jgi:hypothetical protein
LSRGLPREFSLVAALFHVEHSIGAFEAGRLRPDCLGSYK